MITNDFDYRNVSYFDLYLEFSSKFPGKPDWFFKALAKHFDQMYWYIDRSEKNVVGLRNAVTDEAKLDGLYMLDYYLKEVAPVGSEMFIRVVSPSYPILIAKEDLVFDVQVNGNPYRYYAANDLTVTQEYMSVPVFEGTPFSLVLGTTTAGVANQRFIIPLKKVVWYNITVDIDGDPYDRKFHLMDSTNSDKHFRNYYKDNFQLIEFGNGDFGVVPPVGVVTATGFTCAGESARAVASKTSVSDAFISTGALTQSFTLSKIDIQKYSVRIYLDGLESQLDWQFSRAVNGFPIITVGNGVDISKALPVGAVTITYFRTDNVALQYTGGHALVIESYLEADMTNGSDLEDLSAAVELAPKLLEVSNRLGTETDYEYLSKKFSPDVLEVKVLPYYYGEDTVGVHIVPRGGGVANGFLVSSLSDYLNSEDIHYLSNTTVVVSSAYYSQIDVTYSIKKLRSYLYKDYMELSKMAIFLLLCENYKEYKGILQTSGSSAVVTALNKKLNLTLVASKAGELIPVFAFIDRKKSSIWGSAVEIIDIATIVNILVGVAEVQVAFPTADVTVDWDRAGTLGVITCTEII